MKADYVWAWILIGVAFLINGCASSDVSRSAADRADEVFNSAAGAGNVADPLGSYQSAAQATKGGIIGGATGAIAGSFINGVGTVPGALGGAVFGAALGAYIDQHTTWRDRLENAGGKVIILGDQVKIILPSSLLFRSMTPKLTASAYSTLDLVADYLCSMEKIAIKVSAYTNATGPARINQEISQEQATNVARYLWTKGVNARLMTARGYGGSHLVRQNSFEWNAGENYRVEITVENMGVTA
jgi:outer membrane protein OmpA-like peptidoglycan-associated protein